MAPFWRWLATALLFYGALAGGYHLYLEENPRRIAVIVDSSFGMRSVWSRAMEAVDVVEDQRYAEFSLYTEKSKVHGWQRRLDADQLSAYAPRDFASVKTLERGSDLDDATEVILITNAMPEDLGDFDSWTILTIP